MSRVHAITYETLQEDAQNQIMGYVHIGDFKGITTAHVSCWNPTDFLRMMKWGEQSIPMRHKEVHLVHVPSAVKYVIEAGKSMISKKMKDRLQVRITKQEPLNCFGGYHSDIKNTKIFHSTLLPGTCHHSRPVQKSRTRVSTKGTRRQYPYGRHDRLVEAGVGSEAEHTACLGQYEHFQRSKHHFSEWNRSEQQ